MEMRLSDETFLTISAALKQRAQGILEALKAANMSIITAESCTAGMIAAVFSRCDGAGALMHGGFVTYTKAQKALALGVSPRLLEQHGAVNEPAALEMAAGALHRSPATLSIAVTGVLGPEEDEDGNPVGLVYFCAAAKDKDPVVVREEFGRRPADELLRLTIGRAFDLIDAELKHVAL